MCNIKVIILCAFIAASQSYVLQYEQPTQQQIANEEYYLANIYQNQPADLNRQPRSLYIGEYADNNPEAEELEQYEIIALNRQKRQDRGSISATVERNLDRNPQTGTNLNVEAQARLWQSPDRRSTLDGTANYQRNYGGQFGTGRPNYGAGLNFIHRF